MKRLLLSLQLLLLAVPLVAQMTDFSTAVWQQEEAYWKFVKANDLEGYRSLWHSNFLGWPSVSAEPLGKGQITDWITSHTSKGGSLKDYQLERLKIQVTGGIVTTTYRVRLTWVDKNGAGSPQTTRITHTWVNSPNGRWEIISGMSAPTDANGH